jgi:MYXO-CTERM domain-containing protein
VQLDAYEAKHGASIEGLKREFWVRAERGLEWTISGISSSRPAAPAALLILALGFALRRK